MEGFTKKYWVHNLVYYEVYERIIDAIAREKQLKKWKKRWKTNLIEKKIQNGEIYMKKVLQFPFFPVIPCLTRNLSLKVTPL